MKANKFVPGPGQYMSRSFVGAEGSKISMRAIISLDPSEKETKSKPGPGAYEPNFSSTKKKYMQTKFGSEKRNDLAFEKLKLFQ